MRIILIRRISQIFFFSLFAWFCIVSTLGDRFWQLRGWPVNLFLELDPLVASGTALSTHTLYWPLLWTLPVIVLTIVCGRFFCGWICPFGSMHQFTGYLWNRGKSASQMISLNSYNKYQNVKYIILILFLVMAALPPSTASLLTGLLDPIPLITRSFNQALLPVMDMSANITSLSGRFYEGSWLIFFIFAAALLMNLVIPRFYCRFICPLGALLGIMGRFAIFRIGQNNNTCTHCKKCDTACEGACNPGGAIRSSECILCLNCREVCPEQVMHYDIAPSAAGEIPGPDISRKGFLLSVAGSLFVMPVFRLAREIDSNWHHLIIRPPGALAEDEFLKRCIRCGQCIRVCPTNVLQPGSAAVGFENLWTPVLNNRIGTSGCQYNCVACGKVCPTSAIRPLSLDEKHGKGKFKKDGITRVGTAFMDRGRCLPWSMDKPCIVCQENCPESPKAIYTDEIFSTIRGGIVAVSAVRNNTIEITSAERIQGLGLSGDYSLLLKNGTRKKIISLIENMIVLAPGERITIANDDKAAVQVRLQRPYVDIDRCTGCGICEHECPVSGQRAIRISGAGESRSKNRALRLKIN